MVMGCCLKWGWLKIPERVSRLLTRSPREQLCRKLLGKNVTDFGTKNQIFTRNSNHLNKKFLFIRKIPILPKCRSSLDEWRYSLWKVISSTVPKI